VGPCTEQAVAGLGSTLFFNRTGPGESPCAWVVTVPPPALPTVGSQRPPRGVALAFQDLSLPCPFSLWVHNGSSTATLGPLLWSLCGDKPPGFVSPQVALGPGGGATLTLLLPFIPFGTSLAATVVGVDFPPGTTGSGADYYGTEWPAAVPGGHVPLVCAGDGAGSGGGGGGDSEADPGTFMGTMVLSEESSGARVAASGDVDADGDMVSVCVRGQRVCVCLALAITFRASQLERCIAARCIGVSPQDRGGGELVVLCQQVGINTRSCCPNKAGTAGLGARPPLAACASNFYPGTLASRSLI
jgi:hypothetical protein